MSSHCLTAPALSSRQSSALGPQERAPREVSVHLHAQWISGFPSPSLALVLVELFPLAQQSALPLSHSYCITSWLPMAAQSPAHVSTF